MEKSIDYSMRCVISSLSMFSAIFASSSVYASDVSSFDIAGVKLGMSVDEAKKALMDSLGLPPGNIMVDPFPQENVISGKKEPSNIVVKTESYEVVVHFIPNARYERNPEKVVNIISFTMPHTPENLASMKQRVREKYGAPDHVVGGYLLSWCSSPSRVIGCSADDMKLTYSGTRLELRDDGYSKALTEWLNKRRSGKPMF